MYTLPSRRNCTFYSFPLLSMHTLDEMYQKNDEKQKTYLQQAALCDKVLQTIAACRHYKNIDKKLANKFMEMHENCYLRLDIAHSWLMSITATDRALGYDNSVDCYFSSEPKEGQPQRAFTWEGLQLAFQEQHENYLRYADELEKEKKYYESFIAREEKIKALQDEANALNLSGMCTDFFPRSFCYRCRYN